MPVTMPVADEERHWDGLLVQPHPDDIALSCGGRVARRVANGERLVMVTVFSGSPGNAVALTEIARRLHVIWGEVDPDRAWAMRRAEDAEAARLLGVTAKSLGHLDALYRGYCTLGAELHPEDRALQAAIAESIIDDWRLTRGPVDLPLAIGRHPDHRLVFEIGARLAGEGAAVTFYEDFPYVMIEGELERRLAELPPMIAELTDVTDVLDARVRAISAYSSQLRSLSRADGMFRGPYDESVRRHAARLGGEAGRYYERTWRLA